MYTLMYMVMISPVTRFRVPRQDLFARRRPMTPPQTSCSRMAFLPTTTPIRGTNGGWRSGKLFGELFEMAAGEHPLASYPLGCGRAKKAKQGSPERTTLLDRRIDLLDRLSQNRAFSRA